MQISFDWLKDYIELEDDVNKVADDLTGLGLEVEGISQYEKVKGGLKGLVIGEVVDCQKHPNADKLKITSVNVGNGQNLPIVCGAPNVAVGQKVVVAKVGTTLYPTGEESFKIKKSKIRGEVSEGMICAEDEIGIGRSHDGIMVLDADAKIGQEAAEFFELYNDEIIEIGLTPNRADAASHIGVARDLKALYSKDLTIPDVSKFKIDRSDYDIKVKVENPEACPRYSGVVIRNVKIGNSPEWLAERLLSIGINPTNNIVDVTNFVLHELGQPLHAFDLDQVGHEVVVKTGLKGEKFITLDEKERTLDGEDLMICNAVKPMCIAGVFGGIHSGVTEKTTDIFLESAYFSPDWIRKTAMRHGLKTDASFRYERGTDPNITVYALKRAALLIQEVAGGTIASEIMDEYPVKIENREIVLSYSRINQLIGQTIEQKDIDRILGNLDINVVSSEEDRFVVSVPPYRVDVEREADIIEDILRVYGYNNFDYRPLSTDYFAKVSHEDKKFQVQNRVSSLLSDKGFSEIITNSITNSKYVEKIDFLHDDRLIRILNFNSEDLDTMRSNLIFTGLEVLKSNLNRRVDNLKFYEFGKTYQLRDGQRVEREKLMLMMHGAQNEESWLLKQKPLSIIDIYTPVLQILEQLNRKNVEAIPMDSEGKFTYGLKLMQGSNLVGRLGVLNSAFNDLFEIENPVFYAELDWEYLAKKNDKVIFEPLSRFPKVRRDLSLVLDMEKTYGEIEQVTKSIKAPILKEMNVFDVYVGKNLGDNKKSYSISYSLQDSNKTLTDKEIDKVMDRLIQVYEQQLGAVIRK